MSNYNELYKKLKEKYIKSGGQTYDEDNKSEFSNKLLNEVDKLSYKTPEILKEELPEKLNLKKLDEDYRTEDDIKAEVKSLIDLKYGKKKQENEEDYENSIKNINNKKMQNEIQKNENDEKINNIYDNYTQNMENQSLKRGLARSSIIINQLDGIEKERASELSKNAKDYAQKFESLENEIEQLKSSFKKNLSLLEIEKASEERTILNEKLEELEKTKKSILDFNNEIEKMQADYQLKKQKQDIDNAEKLEKILNSDEEKIKQKESKKEQYNLIYNSLKSLGKEEALKELFSNSNYAKYLGESIYDLYYALRYTR